MINMSYQEVQTAIYNRLATFNGLIPVSSFKSQNMPLEGSGAFQIPSNAKWAAYFIQYGQSFISGIDSAPCTRRAGLITFQIFMPKGIGTSDMNTLVEQLTGHFQYYTNQHLEILEASKTFEGATDTAYQTNLSFRFRVN